MKQENTHPMNLSRRDFLKISAGVIGGVVLVGTSTEYVYAAQDSVTSTNSAGSGAKEVEFKDSLKRKERLPQQITKVIPSGVLAQTILSTLCPEKLQTLASEIDESEKADYRHAGMGRLCNLHETGSMYSEGERDINTREIAAIDPEIVIDVGDYKDDLAFSLDYLQMRTDTPTVFVDISFGKLPEAYRSLGKLLNCEARADALAFYIENLYADIKSKKANLETAPRILFAANDDGLSRYEGYSCHDAVIEFLGGIPVQVPSGADPGTIDADSLQNQDIDFVIFNSPDCLLSILSGEGRSYEIWGLGLADKVVNFAASPALYHSWFGSLLFVQIIGILWLGKLICSPVYDYDMTAKAREFYDLFFGYTLTDSEVLKLMGY
jgi:iron complex transport system substrate-binding protein